MDVTTVIRRLHLQTAHGEDEGAVAADLAAMLGGLDEAGRAAVVRHAYWRMPDVPTAVLRDAVGGAAVGGAAVEGDARLRSLAGRGPVTGSCRRCTRVLRAGDRDAVDADPPPLCASCAAVPVIPADRRRRTAAWEFVDAPIPWAADVPPSAAGPRAWAERYVGAAGS